MVQKIDNKLFRINKGTQTTRSVMRFFKGQLGCNSEMRYEVRLQNAATPEGQTVEERFDLQAEAREIGQPRIRFVQVRVEHQVD